MAALLEKHEKRLVAFCEDRLARPLPLLRIAVWTLVFLWLLGYHFSDHPQPLPVAQPPGETMCGLAGRLAPDGFNVVPLDPSPDRLDVVWIGGSSLQIWSESEDGAMRPEFIPNLIDRTAAFPVRKEARVMMYLMVGARMYDLYLCVLHSLEQQPDCIVLALNPCWACNDQAISFWTNLYPDAVRYLPARPADYLLYAALAGPAPSAEGAFASFLPGLDSRYANLTVRANRVRADWGALLRDSFGVSSFRETPGVLIEQPFDYWAAHELGALSEEEGQEFRQKQILSHYVRPEACPLSTFVMSRLLRVAAGSGVPTLIYLAPVKQSVRRVPEMEAALTGTKRWLEGFRPQLDGSAVHVETCSAVWPIPDHEFRDLLHLAEPKIALDHFEAMLREFARDKCVE